MDATGPKAPVRELNMVEAVCLVAGAGIGGGVMAVPYLAARTGFLPALLIMLGAYAITVVLHIMVAELSIRTGYSSELLTVFTKHLFRGRRFLRGAFYVLMAITLACNLAAYITGAGEILANLLGLHTALAETIFFVFAALVVFLGLKRVAVNEVFALAAMLVFLATLVVRSFALPSHGPLGPALWEPSPVLAVYGLAMFSLSSLFAVPQAASGLRGAKHLLPLAVALGLFFNLAVMAVITLCALLCSDPVTEVAIVGWTASLGGPTRIFGSLFIVLAMLGTFWSISLQLSDMTKEYFRAGRAFSWLAATAPSFLLALLPASGFLALMQIAGGGTAVVVACMAVPAYRIAVRGTGGLRPGPDRLLLGPDKLLPELDRLLLGPLGKSRLLCGAIIAMYLLMAVASFA